jgi:hypothetical protein
LSATKNELEASEVLRLPLATRNHHVPNQNGDSFAKRKFSTRSKHRPSSPNMAPAWQINRRTHLRIALDHALKAMDLG